MPRLGSGERKQVDAESPGSRERLLGEMEEHDLFSEFDLPLRSFEDKDEKGLDYSIQSNTSAGQELNFFGSRVNVLRNGKGSAGFACKVPETMLEFLRNCQRLFKQPDINRVWNRQGFEICNVAEFIPDEVVFVGANGESFVGVSSKKIVPNFFSSNREKMWFRMQNEGANGTLSRKGLFSIGIDENQELEDDDDDDDQIPSMAGLTIAKRDRARNSVNDVNGEGTYNFWMDPDFDISAQNLIELFDLFDTEKTGVISYEQFRTGLEEFNLTQKLSDFEFSEIVRQIDIDKSGDIKKIEFIKALQNMVINSRFIGSAPSKTGVLRECFVYDYGLEGYRYRSTLNFKNPLIMKDLLNEPEGPQSPHRVRWIHVTGDHLPTLYGLATSYNLNNFEVEDALTGFERSRFVEHSMGIGDWCETGGHIQIVVRVIHPKKRPPLRLKEEQMTIFCTKDTVITVQDKPESAITFKLQSRISGNIIPTDNSRTSGNLDASNQPRGMRRFMASKIRRNGAEYLVYSIIDRIVDYANSTLFQFNRELGSLEREVNSPSNTRPSTMKSVHRIKREMTVLMDFLRPLQQTVSKLVEHLRSRVSRKQQILLQSNIRKQLEQSESIGTQTEYLSEEVIEWKEIIDGYNDIKDHIELMNAQITYLHNWCMTLNEQYQNQQSHRMNEVMYLLTLVTTIFVPAQFITGVYGMNFDVMPELRWKYSYLTFWIAIGSIGLFTFVYFKAKRWL